MDTLQPVPTLISSDADQSGRSIQTHLQQKPRFTRAEKRQFAKEKQISKVTQTVQRRKKPGKKSTDAGLTSLSTREVDEMIVRLLRVRDQTGGKDNPARSLEDRITRDLPKNQKKELSPKKLEKIQKRRDLRAEKRQVHLAKKAADDGQPAGKKGASSAFAQTAGVAVDGQPTLQETDEIDWNEL